MWRKDSTITAVALVAIGAGFCYFLFFGAPVEPWPALAPAESATSTPALSGQNLPVREIPSGSREYHSAQYRFSLFYPQELAVVEHPLEGYGMILTFQNVQTAEGFQIFIAPDNEPQVSEARFKRDEPSGVRKGVTGVAVDGATGAAFYSVDALLGETREVWFLHGGFLFEVTTLKPLDAWLQPILSTWHFL